MDAKAVTACLMAGALAGQAMAQDMGGCPLDAMTFRDASNGRLFVVDRVGSVALTACGGSPVLVRTDATGGRSDCQRSRSYTILEGRFLEADASHIAEVWATWSVLPAAPCCSWSFDLGENEFANIAWDGSGAAQNHVLELIDWARPYEGASLDDIGAEAEIPLRRGTFTHGSVLRPFACDS